MKFQAAACSAIALRDISDIMSRSGNHAIFYYKHMEKSIIMWYNTSGTSCIKQSIQSRQPDNIRQEFFSANRFTEGRLCYMQNTL